MRGAWENRSFTHLLYSRCLWREQLSNILHTCNYFDPAGDVTRCVRELNKYSKHYHESIIKDPHPLQSTFQYEGALASEVTQEHVDYLGRWADAVIFHFVGPDRGYRFPGKPCAFRSATAYYHRKQDKFWATYDVTARDLSCFDMIGTNHLGARDFLGFDARFLPSLIPINDPLYLPNWAERAPCVSMTKNPEEFYNKPYNGNPTRQYLYGLPHRTVMDARRDHATIILDNQVDGHLGLASLEAMSMGLPAVAFNHEKTKEQLRDLSIGDYPPGMIEVGPYDDVIDAVNLHLNPSLQERRLIRDWMERSYSPARLVKRYWDPFIGELLDTKS